MNKCSVTLSVQIVNIGIIETIKGMCFDARREINHLEATLFEIVNQSMTKLISSINRFDGNMFQVRADISEQYRKSYERNCFNGLRSIKKCLSFIQNEFESNLNSNEY